MKVTILHEGKSIDKDFFKLLYMHLGICEEKLKERVDFIGMGTKSNFFKLKNQNYRLLKSEIQREEVAKVLFIIDADYEKNDNIYGGYENTKIELEKIIRELNLADCSDICITCDFDNKDGYLESLILSSIPQKQKECIENFLKCSDFKSKENDKAILNQIYKSAYPNAPYDFTSKYFDELKQKLKNLFE